MAKKIKKRDLFIVKHTETLARVIAVTLMVWFFSGIILIDIINPVVFIVIYIPIGLIAAFWAQKW